MKWPIADVTQCLKLSNMYHIPLEIYKQAFETSGISRNSGIFSSPHNTIGVCGAQIALICFLITLSHASIKQVS